MCRKAQKNLKKSLNRRMPLRYGRIGDEVCWQDRLDFEEHLPERVRWRKYGHKRNLVKADRSLSYPTHPDKFR